MDENFSRKRSFLNDWEHNQLNIPPISACYNLSTRSTRFTIVLKNNRGREGGGKVSTRLVDVVINVEFYDYEVN